MTLAKTNKYSKQMDKKDRTNHVFDTKLRFIMYGKHMLYLSLINSLHTR